jgi:hypothetical protein
LIGNARRSNSSEFVRLGLFKEEDQQQLGNAPCCCSSKLELPDEHLSAEETLKTLAAALKALETPGLERNEILRSA